ncbi:MAG: TetR/AcrR family transcriptional regulator [Acidobacteriota bacterium]
MPWKKNFDVDEAIVRAMYVFWDKGFANTSMTDLTDAIGVPRQSLYNAVGSKKELFIRSLLRYDAHERQPMLSSFEARGEPRQAICDFFHELVEVAANDPQKRGCFLVNTSLSIAQHDKEIRVLVSGAFDNFRGFFERLIDHAKTREEVPEELDTEATASGLMALFIGIIVMSRGTCRKEQLMEMAAQAPKLLEVEGV